MLGWLKAFFTLVYYFIELGRSWHFFYVFNGLQSVFLNVCNAENFFSIYVFHGGQFMDVGRAKVYVGGGEDFLDDYDPDRFLFWELVDVRMKLQYKDLVEFWYKEPRSTENDGLVQVMGDKEVLQMINSITEVDRVIKVYLVHYGDVNFL